MSDDWIDVRSAAVQPSASPHTGSPQGAMHGSELPANGIIHASAFGRLPEPDWLIDELVPAGSLVMTFGAPNCGKSFCTLDAALAIARGIPWFGRPVKQGPVLYLCLEGARSFRHRIAAYCQAHGVEAAAVPFYGRPRQADLVHQRNDSAQIVEWAKDIKPLVIVVDTVSRAIGGANENDGQDMAKLIRNVDRIREESGATVWLIHHPSKADARSPRGHSKLIGEPDTHLHIAKPDDIATLEVTKQRDGETGQKLCFRLKRIELGPKPGAGKPGGGPSGGPVSSCIVEPLSKTAVEEPVLARLKSARQRNAYVALRTWSEETGYDSLSFEQFRDLMTRQGIVEENGRRAAVTELRNQLQAKQAIAMRDGKIHLARPSLRERLRDLCL